MKWSLIIGGSIKASSIKESAEDYLKRISHYHSIDMQTVKESKNPDDPKPWEKMLQPALKNKAYVLSLDPEGENRDSIAFSNRVNQWLLLNKPCVFLVGGAFGYPNQLNPLIHEKISLSLLTLQNDIAILVFLEQLYRAFTLLNGESYHK